MAPFATRDEAAYWGGGVLAEDRAGGRWSLHAYTSPTGVETYHVGRDGRADGFPATTTLRHGVQSQSGGIGIEVWYEADE